jgi:hypothetical protein
LKRKAINVNHPIDRIKKKQTFISTGFEKSIGPNSKNNHTESIQETTNTRKIFQSDKSHP